MDLLLTNFNSNLPSFMNGVLRDNRAVIAGGSIVCTLLDIKINDFDVYVNIKNAVTLMETLINEYNYTMKHLTITEDDSYGDLFKQKAILCRAILVKQGEHPIDIMVTLTDPLSCASMFDLTCCQVWYDGSSIYGTHLESFFNKIGYQHPFYLTNKHSQKRVVKYSNRGFKLSVMNPTDPFFNINPKPIDLSNLSVEVKQRLDYIQKMYQNTKKPVESGWSWLTSWFW